MLESRSRIVVLFGPPAVGKDTVTAVLTAKSARYEHFRKLKCGSGSRHGYTIITTDQLIDLRAAGRVVSEVARYGSVYVVERNHLETSLAAGRCVLIHSAEVAEARALLELGAILVLMECSRAVAAERLRRRDPKTVDERLQVWDQVQSNLDLLNDAATLRLSTDSLDAPTVASFIDRVVTGARRV